MILPRLSGARQPQDGDPDASGQPGSLDLGSRLSGARWEVL